VAQPPIRFYTKEFFEELAWRLNADDSWGRTMQGHDLRIVCSALDVKRAFLIDIRDGRVATAEAGPDTPANFRLEAHYDTWVKLCKGEAEIDTLIQRGKVRLAGPISEAMGLMGPLNHLVMVARGFPKEF